MGITDWIRKGSPSDDGSPTNEFATIDQMLPPKKKQSPDERAKDIEGVLNWMRSNIPSVPFDEGIEKLHTPSVPVSRRSPKDRQKDVDDITDWIRKGRPSDDDSPTDEFAAIDQMLPPKKNQSPDNRARYVEGVLNWMRSNNIPPVPSDDDKAFDKLPSVPVSRRSPEDRQKDVDDITDWIRKARPSDDGSPTNEFATIDQMLPPKKKQSPDERAKDIEGVLNWMRSNVPSVPFDEGIDSLRTPSVPVKRRSPEDRQKDR